MNPLDKFPEVKRNKDYIKALYGGVDTTGRPIKLYEIRTDKLRVYGYRWRDLSSRWKRKFENLLVLSEPQQKMRFRYL